MLSLAAINGPQPARPRTCVRRGPKPRTGSARALDRAFLISPAPNQDICAPFPRAAECGDLSSLFSRLSAQPSLGGTKKAPNGCANHMVGQGTSYSSGSSFWCALPHTCPDNACKHSWFHPRPRKCWGAGLHFPAEATKARKKRHAIYEGAEFSPPPQPLNSVCPFVGEGAGRRETPGTEALATQA